MAWHENNGATNLYKTYFCLEQQQILMAWHKYYDDQMFLYLSLHAACKPTASALKKLDSTHLLDTMRERF